MAQNIFLYNRKIALKGDIRFLMIGNDSQNTFPNGNVFETYWESDLSVHEESEYSTLPVINSDCHVSKTVLRMFIRLLVHFLCVFKVPRKTAKF